MSVRSGLFRFAGLALLGPLLVVLLSRAAPPEPRQPFNTELVRRLERLRPEVVLLGNSMVNSRFSEPELARLLAPMRVAVIGVGGSKSAFWYLALKNVILPARPKKVLLFYRRRELTTPGERALGAEHHRLDRVARADDPLVEEVLAPHWDTPVARLGWTLGQLAPVGRLRALVSTPLDGFAAGTASLLVEGSRRGGSKEALESVFAVGKLRPSDFESAGTEKEVAKFQEALPRSFLPAIVKLVTSAGVELTFLRVRTRSDAAGTAGRARRKGGYDDSLERYVREHGAEHVDLTDDDFETLSLFGEGDHIAPRHRKRYTRLFAEHHRDVFD